MEVERLDRTMAILGAVAPEMEDAVRQRFSDPIVIHRTELRRLAERVNASGSSPKCWADFEERRKQCASLAREYLAFALGGFARQAGLDDGLLRIADAFLAELSERVKVRWDPLTVLAETEWYGEEEQIIRLRFPETSVWNLPMAAHEFGHFAGPRLAVRTESGRVWDLANPVADVLRRESDRGSADWSRMHEFFADAFAVFLTGPAYACTSLLLRFDPTIPDPDYEPTHPGNAKRAYLMTRMLEKMDQESGSTSYRGVVRELREHWRASVIEAGTLDARQVAELEAKVAADVEPTVGEIWELLQQALPAQRYRGMATAQALKPALLGTASASAAAPTLADVLNAAWLCRLDHWDDDRDRTAGIATGALRLCQAIADRAAGAGP